MDKSFSGWWEVSAAEKWFKIYITFSYLLNKDLTSLGEYNRSFSADHLYVMDRMENSKYIGNVPLASSCWIVENQNNSPFHVLLRYRNSSAFPDINFPKKLETFLWSWKQRGRGSLVTNEWNKTWSTPLSLGYREDGASCFTGTGKTKGAIIFVFAYHKEGGMVLLNQSKMNKWKLIPQLKIQI